MNELSMRMARLYEKFILEYYRHHHTYLSEVKAAQVKWDLRDENADSMIRFLPVMQTDITLRLKEKVLIIDAKYYGKTLQKQFDKYTLHSANVYQILSYVQNKKFELLKTGKPHDVVGMLLYARTNESIQPDGFDKKILGNRMITSTLDLDQKPYEIAKQLDGIAEMIFGPKGI